MKIILLAVIKSRMIFRKSSIFNMFISLIFLGLQTDNSIYYVVFQYWTIFSIALFFTSILIPIHKTNGLLIIDNLKIEMKTTSLDKTILMKDVKSIDVVYSGFSGEMIYSQDIYFFPSISKNKGIGKITINTNDNNKYYVSYRASVYTIRQFKLLSLTTPLNIVYNKNMF